MAGKRGEFGSRLAKGSVAPADTTLMRRFREAGLVTLGRTNCPEMAISTTTEPVLHGATRNPWNLALTPGGSSGGAAAAVAAGIVPLAHANDAGGSIRVPAALCGLFGMKPTRGRVSNGPDLDEVFSGLGVQLGVSRTVRDSAALLDAIAGVEVGEPYSTAPPARTFLSEVGRDPGELRIGVMTRAWNGACSAPAVQEAALAAARHCESLGHHVETTSLDLGVDWDAFVHACAHIFASHLVAWIDAIAAGTGRLADASTLEPATLTCYRYGRAARAVDLIGALAIRNLVTRHVGQFFARYDVLLTPTLPTLSLPLGKYAEGVESLDGPGWLRRVFDHSPFTPLFNMAGTPAMSVPLAEDAATRLPIGVQFAAGFGREDQLFRLAGQLERTLPWAGRRAAVWAGA
jgi:amidase